MPRALVPHKSGAHRLACLSLYKALLRQCSLLSVPRVGDEVPQSAPNAFREFLRYRFRKDRKLESPTRVANGLKSGSSLLDQLQACNAGSSIALTQLTDLLESTLFLASSKTAYRAEIASLRPSMTKDKRPKAAFIQANATKANHVRQPDVKTILARPLPLEEIPGKERKVPFLVSAHGIPFLRYGKSQSIELGRYLRQQRASDSKKWGQREEMETDKLMAEFEDIWDNIIRKHHGIMDGQKGAAESYPEEPRLEGYQFSQEDCVSSEPSWATPLKESDKILSLQLKARTSKRSEMGRRLWAIAVEERELARQEKIERRAQRKTQKTVGDHRNVEASQEGRLLRSRYAADSKVLDGLAGITGQTS